LTPLLREAFNRIRSFFRKDPLDREFNEEMASHLEMAREENIRRGMSPDDARREASDKTRSPPRDECIHDFLPSLG